MVEMTLREARELLAEYAEMAATRDQRIRTAHASGVSVMEIHKITGLARTTIQKIIESETEKS